MTRLGLASIGFEVAVGVAAQASGIGGAYVAAPAGLLAIATGGYLYASYRSSREELIVRLRTLVSERRAVAPPASDRAATAEFEADTMECFRRRFAPEVQSYTQLLVQRGAIGAHEQRRITKPANLDAIDALADRLADLKALSIR